MVPQNRPYQIQELSENGTLKFVWIFPLLPVDVSYKMEDKYSFYGANKLKGQDIEMQNDKTANVSEFVEKVRRYTEIG